MAEKERTAPGGPGTPPRWTSSAKTGVGTALNASSRVWFTLSHGIFNEIYYPRVDQACTRDMGLLVAGSGGFLSEEKRDSDSEISYLAAGVPAFRLVNTCKKGRYRIEKEVLTDPLRDVVLQRTRFLPLQGKSEEYRLFVLLAPHLNNQGSNNTAWTGAYKGTPMLFASHAGHALALACSTDWRKMSVGFVGSSDGWRDLHQHKEMQWTYTRVENGNVALTAEIDLAASGGEFVIALGFGISGAEAGQRARASLLEGFDTAREGYIRPWREWQQSLLPLEADTGVRPDMYPLSATVLRIHEAKAFAGGVIASLSVPWGFAKGDNDLGGYHLIWPRDLVEAAGGFLAAGAPEEALRIIRYLESTQEEDGHWTQNAWLDGTAYWDSVQMDETALPLLLLDLARRQGALEGVPPSRFWGMVEHAVSFLVRNGPVTLQDRWEEDPGYSPFTLAAEIAALLSAADLADENGRHGEAAYLRETADAWNTSIERWIYKKDTELARTHQVEGYYVRIEEPDTPEASSPASGFVPIKKRPPDRKRPAADLLSPDFLALVRFGLRAPDDPRILSTLRIVDSLLKVDTPYGPVWRRYTGDLYGEHEDGAPYDGSGIGRAWPLLTGERAHYELAAGRRGEAERLLRTLASSANTSGMIPEQVWDAADIPKRELAFGQPSGSAMPLVWAHAEYIKVKRSLQEGRVFDMPPQTAQRYLVEKRVSPHAIWRFNQKARSMPQGRVLRIEVLVRAVVHWGADGWKEVRDTPTRDTGLGIHLADIPTQELPHGEKVNFTFYWPDAQRWEQTDFAVLIE
ncbi:MAG: glucan 1,4-alpha-glucosidase [Thermodesulfovibrionales bacterium]